MRLDKYLTDLTVLSRSEAKKAVRAGRVTVNATKASDPDLKIKEGADKVSLDGKPLEYRRFNYFLLNKPAGVVSATKDPGCKTVIDLFESEYRRDLFPVGRLDKDTTGLLIITDDGELGHHLTSPRHGVSKKYLARIKAPLSQSDIDSLSAGVDIGSGERSAPAVIEPVSDLSVYITVTEGKYHEVKRMLLAVGNEVLSLKRVSMGPITLDPELKEGEYRRLSDSEIDQLHEDT